MAPSSYLLEYVRQDPSGNDSLSPALKVSHVGLFNPLTYMFRQVTEPLTEEVKQDGALVISAAFIFDLPFPSLIDSIDLM